MEQPNFHHQPAQSNLPHGKSDLHAFIQEQREFQRKQDNYIATIVETLSHLTLSPSNTQNTHQASTSSGLPSQPQPNPKGSINAITLRSGTKLNEVSLEPTSLSKEPHNKEIEEEVEVIGDEKENIARDEEELLKVKEPKRKNPLEEPTPISFPRLATKAKKHEDLDPNVVEIFKNVKVTVPLSQAIKQKNDSGHCLVTCVIGGTEFTNCMCDLGACVSIMPLPVYEKLNLSPLKRSGVRFVLADKSIVSVVGIAENVLINIQGLLFPVDFHILETPLIDSNWPSSILIERPFLKTSRFKLDAFSGTYSFKADEKMRSLCACTEVRHTYLLELLKDGKDGGAERIDIITELDDITGGMGDSKERGGAVFLEGGEDLLGDPMDFHHCERVRRSKAQKKKEQEYSSV
ncbi:uncharacterized protein LOC107460436 [Arachis duranensis]|uniref:Uncharacterized protein LOC107460436 n=1 Tax=Arachis duranensis TaxID=130453 RepID=A0A6P4B5J9_ARADU|nr:uncharacterized protein LOC107460436 [Arachis duranensis]